MPRVDCGRRRVPALTPIFWQAPELASRALRLPVGASRVAPLGSLQGKNIIWPDTRRVIQLSILAVVAQVAFIIYILGLNYLLNSIPVWFEKALESLKAGGAS